jgi:hypothetical protein
MLHRKPVFNRRCTPMDTDIENNSILSSAYICGSFAV